MAINHFLTRRMQAINRTAQPERYLPEFEEGFERKNMLKVDPHPDYPSEDGSANGGRSTETY